MARAPKTRALYKCQAKCCSLLHIWIITVMVLPICWTQKEQRLYTLRPRSESATFCCVCSSMLRRKLPHFYWNVEKRLLEQVWDSVTGEYIYLTFDLTIKGRTFISLSQWFKGLQTEAFRFLVSKVLSDGNSTLKKKQHRWNKCQKLRGWHLASRIFFVDENVLVQMFPWSHKMMQGNCLTPSVLEPLEATFSIKNLLTCSRRQG